MIPNKVAVVIGGGTINKISPHFALCAPAYGSTARKLCEILKTYQNTTSEDPKPLYDVELVLTKMADSNSVIETNEDLEAYVDSIISDYNIKLVFFSAAVCDFESKETYEERLKSDSDITLSLTPSAKMIGKIRKARKDIFLVGFKSVTTNVCGWNGEKVGFDGNKDKMFQAGLELLKKSSCNLVLVNDIISYDNMIITPEESSYCHTKDRDVVLKELVAMSYLRSHLTFTRSTVVSGEAIDWNSDLVPKALRSVVNYCISRGAYKPFMGATVGHFACKLDDTTFLTSIRKSNFNNINNTGLVKIKTDGPDTVIAYGMKPSVGGQSQRIIFSNHKEYDCIVHFHCVKRAGSKVPTVSQREYECGSHQCGQNTASGLMKFGNLSAVYLDNHGPNIVFHSSIDPFEVTNFIEENFDLDCKTTNIV